MNRPTYEQSLLESIAHRGLRAVVNRVLEKEGLNTSEWIILGLINDRPNKLRVTDIADILRVEDPLVTNLAHDLINKRLVKSVPHKKDGRARVLALSAKGTKLVDKLEPVLAKALAPIEACASPADWATYFATLEKIITATDGE